MAKTYSAIAAAERDAESPITTAVMSKFANNPVALYENARKYALCMSDSAECTSDDTLNSDTVLTFAVESGHVWVYEFGIYVSTSINAGFRYKVLTPSETATGHQSVTYSAFNVATASAYYAWAEHTNTETVVTVPAGVGGWYLYLAIHGWTYTSASGSITLQWAQGASHADPVKVETGSYVSARCTNYITG